MEIDINGVKWLVEAADGKTKKLHPEKDRINLGLTEYCKGIITIRQGMSESVTRSTVIHELIHAFLFSFGYEVNGEESMCNFFGSQADRIMKLTDEIMKGVNFNADRKGNTESD